LTEDEFLRLEHLVRGQLGLGKKQSPSRARRRIQRKDIRLRDVHKLDAE
jgi:hypothetical protein